MLLNVLAVGDVVGEGGQDIVSRRLPGLREETGAHFTVVLSDVDEKLYRRLGMHVSYEAKYERQRLYYK